MVSESIQPSSSSTQSEGTGKEQGRTKAERTEIIALDLDSGDESVRVRRGLWEFWIPKHPPSPPPSGVTDSTLTPYATANFISILWYSWITPIMTLGYQRTLQAADLWKLEDTHTAATLTSNFDASWQRRYDHAKDYNADLSSGHAVPSLFKRVSWSVKSTFSSKSKTSFEEEWRNETGIRKASIPLALNDSLGRFFWTGGFYKVLADVTQLMGPLLVREIINFAKEREFAKENGLPKPNVGRGIALAIGLFLLTVTFSIAQNQFFWRSMLTGALTRATLISSMYKRSVNLTGKARTNLSTSDIVNHVSTDVSRIDICCQWFHASWTAPIQIVVCLIILVTQLGPSALAGFALFLLIGPIQQRVMRYQFTIRQKSMGHTDQRAKTLLEALSSMRIVKYFTYESSFLQRISGIRKHELRGVRTILNAESANMALAHSVPYLAATLAFITYTRIKEEFDVAIIFSSLALFQLLRQPMMFLPRGLSVIADAQSAFHRLERVFHAELMTGESLQIVPNQELSLCIQDASFEWEETVLKEDEPTETEKVKSKAVNHDTPFQLKGINVKIPRGSLTAIVGRVGSGKSSLLQAMIGEMRKTSGEVVFGGRVAYCPQTAWIQNSSLRDNVTFGQPFDEERYWKVIEDASLLPDLQLLADGDLTEIGEKGINLSGGQKQRINIARALYFDADVIIMDDPLSAVDAHVGKALFRNAISALSKRGKTVILVTHALHFLSFCDYIYTLDGGAITEQGTYRELLDANGEFARLDKEFGGNDPGAMTAKRSHIEVLEEVQTKSTQVQQRFPGKGTLEGKLIVKELRTTGSISGKVWWAYIVAGRGAITVPLLLLAAVLMQGSQIISSYILVWWQKNEFSRPFSFYQILYAVFGISQALLSLFLGVAVDVISWLVSRNLHNEALLNIFRAPMSFFDTTPLGRVIGVFGKDIDIIDNQLPVSMRMLVLTVSGVIGSVALITAVEPYFIIVAVFVGIGYNFLASFYRASAREIKRLDSILRSLLYSHLSESLTGLPTLRSYGQLPRFVRDNEFFIDLENRALFLLVTNQRWLTVRLDVCGAALVFFVAFFAVMDVSGLSPAQVGLILTFTTTLTQMCGMLMRQTAEVENYMNAVERVVHYSDKSAIPQEARHEDPPTDPPSEWPEHGKIEFQDVVMRYRPGLTNVLHGISMSIKGGEKIGVVGRTGAGKSSLIMALMRIVEYSGNISIDGVDISKLGLKVLRSKISIIPQDPTIFSGTVRTALDPFSLYDDARLWDALRRSFLVEDGTSDDEKSSGDASCGTRITLDTVLESEGSNLSVGERSLLSLARALVKDTKVVVLDEATASVDLETDKKIQYTIQTQFEGQTLICIAHRLRTILGYDRVLVLDSGSISEFDSPLALFNKEDGIFRSLCLGSNIVEEDILTSKTQ
ncbi:ABC protein [Coprinopsis marcescibilis]|uniref:ABC protein n=1 Tax=Coprinopsis marcescibilis TaxID=230819 RepID=A0A5C3L7Y0_COPMA|nr:ABC protein [Coprinopsis marcescibilis]